MLRVLIPLCPEFQESPILVFLYSLSYHILIGTCPFRLYASYIYLTHSVNYPWIIKSTQPAINQFPVLTFEAHSRNCINLTRHYSTFNLLTYLRTP